MTAFRLVPEAPAAERRGIAPTAIIIDELHHSALPTMVDDGLTCAGPGCGARLVGPVIPASRLCRVCRLLARVPPALRAQMRDAIERPDIAPMPPGATAWFLAGGAPTCRHCGRTEASRAPGVFWAEPDLCSACADHDPLMSLAHGFAFYAIVAGLVWLGVIWLRAVGR